MTKKRITDLLRQEAQKLPDAEGTPVIEVTAEEVPEQDAEAVEELSTNMPNNSGARHTNLTKADLEATVTQLRSALEQAQQKESSLQQQIADVQSDLDEQKTFVQKLQKDLEKANQLKAELEQAKKAALQLAEANSQLIQEVNALKKEQENLKRQGYKKAEHNKIEKFDPEPTKEPADFATNSWLL